MYDGDFIFQSFGYIICTHIHIYVHVYVTAQTTGHCTRVFMISILLYFILFDFVLYKIKLASWGWHEVVAETLQPFFLICQTFISEDVQNSRARKYLTQSD